MPKYIYQCQYCDLSIETVHSMSEDYTGLECPKCEKDKAMEKLPNYLGNLIDKSEKKEEPLKVGELTKAAIKEMKNDLRDWQQELTETLFDDSD